MTRKKLWTKSFIILWQASLVSNLGNTAYGFALGFWVLSVTGSTAIMGTVRALSMIPVIFAPFAGAIIDRCDRKHLAITMDLIRGLLVSLIAIAAFTGTLEIWMVLTSGVLLTACGMVFGPAIDSAMPEIIDRSNMTNANSLFSFAYYGADMLGNVAGGVIYKAVGAPILFLFDGLSFIFSGASISFIKIPKIIRTTKKNILRDIRDGFAFLWKCEGLRYNTILTAVMNFFYITGCALLLPLFYRDPSLGAAKYGIAAAALSGGMVTGFLLLSIVSVKPKKRMRLLTLSFVMTTLCFILAVNLNSFVLFAVLLFISGFSSSNLLTTMMSAVQIATPREMRGKILSCRRMISSSLNPVALALGGILAEFISIRLIISVSFALMLLTFLPICVRKSFRKYITFDPEKDDIEELLPVKQSENG